MSHRKSSGHKRKSGGGVGGIFKLLFLLGLLAGIGFLAVKFGPLIVTGRFNSAERFNMVLSAPDKTSLLSLDAKSGKATLVNFPQDLYVSRVAHGYGQYPIGKVYDVGQLDKKGGEVLSDTVSFYLGLPVDGFSRLPSFSLGNVKGLLMSPGFLMNQNSNVNLWDRILLTKAFMDVRFDKMVTIDLSKKSEPLILADGTVAKMIVEEDLDNLLEGFFAEEDVLKEDLRIQVVNTTEMPGLGASVSRVISGLGATVIDVTTEEPELETCKILASDKFLKSKTAKRIGKIFSCEIVLEKDLGRADLIILLGREQGKLFAN